MTNLDLKKAIISELQAKRIDFKKDVFELSLSDITLLSESAKACKYKKPKTAYCGLGGSFYLHLQKIANK